MISGPMDIERLRAKINAIDRRIVSHVTANEQVGVGEGLQPAQDLREGVSAEFRRSPRAGRQAREPLAFFGGHAFTPSVGFGGRGGLRYAAARAASSTGTDTFRMWASRDSPSPRLNVSTSGGMGFPSFVSPSR